MREGSKGPPAIVNVAYDAADSFVFRPT
jgi:hypothetical protein